MKKLLCLTLTLALILCLCACGSGGEGILRMTPELSFEQKLARSAQALQAVGSFHMDMDMDMSMGIRVMGVDRSADVNTHHAADIRYEPMQFSMEMEIASMGEQQKMLYYGEQAGDGLTVYYSMDNGAHWARESIPSLEQVMPQEPGELTQIFLSCTEGFSEAGKDSVNGTEVTVYTGLISGDYVAQAIKAAGSLESVSQLLNVPVSEEMFRELADIPASVAIDEESGMVLRYTMDMSDAMGNLVSKLMEKLLEQYGGGSLPVEISMDQVNLTVTLSQFDQVPEIVIPDAARAA